MRLLLISDRSRFGGHEAFLFANSRISITFRVSIVKSLFSNVPEGNICDSFKIEAHNLGRFLNLRRRGTEREREGQPRGGVAEALMALSLSQIRKVAVEEGLQVLVFSEAHGVISFCPSDFQQVLVPNDTPPPPLPLCVFALC
jgi:hypothetical protein